MTSSARYDAVIVGGGLAGLAAAAALAGRSRSVLLLEKAARLGGRARTDARDGYALNLGPHALYRTGEGARVLAELGVRPQGRRPAAWGQKALAGGRLVPLPASPFALATSPLLGPAGRLELALFFARLARIAPAPLDGTSQRAWIETRLRDAGARRLVDAFARLATYGHDPDRASAGAVVRQLQRAARGGVLYLDGGWERLVRDLEARVREAGAAIRCRAGVAAVGAAPEGLTVRLDDGSRIEARAVLLATDPGTASRLVANGTHPVLSRAARRAIPVRVASLDVALARRPRRRHAFALGVDRPLYVSIHSDAARLAPPGGVVLHAARYLATDETSDPASVRRELEDAVDRLQPGWRDAVVRARFLPELVVCSALPTALEGGIAGRPGPRVDGMDGLFVAGDWVGPEGLLADASLASAVRAARAIALSLSATRMAARPAC